MRSSASSNRVRCNRHRLRICDLGMAAIVATVLGLLQAGPTMGQAIVPPPRPDVAPLIARTYSNDADANRIDDALETRINQAVAQPQGAAAPQTVPPVQAQLQ